MSARCGCTQALKFTAGFKYDQFGFWPAIKLSNSGWASLTSAGQSETLVRADRYYDNNTWPLALVKPITRG